MTVEEHSEPTRAPPDSPEQAGLDVAEQRVDAVEKVTGRALYAADRAPQEALWASTLTSPLAHARIQAVDTRQAEAVPGVHVVLTGADLAPARFGRRLLDWPVLCWDRVRFVGDRVAAVAAETPEAAAEAVERIHVRYKELPAVLRVEDAVAEGAPLLHESLSHYVYKGSERPPIPSGRNLQSYGRKGQGEGRIPAIFREADHVFEHTFTTPRQPHWYLEPHATSVWIDERDVVHVISTNKDPDALQEQMSLTTGVPVDRIRVHSGSIGGDFGGKGLSVDEFVCYFLARASGRCVQAVMGHGEDMRGTNPRHAARMTLRTAVSTSGRFLAHHADLLFDGGAYAAAKPNSALQLRGGFDTMSPYRIDHALVETRVAYTNTVPAGHMRAPGQVQAAFAGESHVDMIAAGLNVDPVTLRLKNAVRGADPSPTGERCVAPRAEEVLAQLQHLSFVRQEDGPNRGRGISFGLRHVGGLGRTADVTMRLRSEGIVEVGTALVDQGAGAQTIAQRVAAAVLSVDPASVSIVKETAPGYLAGVGGSRTTHLISRATEAGAAEMRARLESGACAALGVPEGSLRLENGRFRAAEPATDGPTLAELAPALVQQGGVEVVGHYDGQPAAADKQGVKGAHFCNFAGCMVDVEVDPRTGMITVHDAVLAIDVGTVISPLSHQGQVDGGFVYGLSAALGEELPVTKPEAIHPGRRGCAILSALDIPPLRTVLLRSEDGPGAFGAKGIGELINPLVAPAVANAVRAAVGARVTTLPLTAQRVREALRAAREQGCAPPP